jgi:adenylosuccinate lyase
MTNTDKPTPTPPSRHDGYESPLGGRYASKEMQRIWSARHKFELWRKIWLAVAKAQKACGVNITDEQIAELEAHLEVTDADIARAADHEKRLRHDVMSHVHALGDICPMARPIIHLGMTSEDVNGNAELVLIHAAIRVIDRKIDLLRLSLGDFAHRWRSLPTLGLTHFQPAQPTTVGRRAAMWANDVRLSQQYLIGPIGVGGQRVRGFRGATGTGASFQTLFSASSQETARFEALALWDFNRQLGHYDEHATLESWLSEASEHWSMVYPDKPVDAHWVIDGHCLGLTGQTYPRVYDAMVLSSLGCIAAVLHKIATDIRLLSNKRELEEPFEADQIGSSAMPYKRNPMRCERICGLARFVMNLVPNALDTAATQWLERTLDDSANRRLTLPEAFLALDGCLDLMRNVISGLVVNEAMVTRNLMAEMPFLATEHLMMQAVGLGKDRQDVHEAIRLHSMAAVKRMKTEGADNDLLDRLKKEPLLQGVDFSKAMDPMAHIGLAVEQTERFLREHIDPLREELQDDDNPVGPSV